MGLVLAKRMNPCTSRSDWSGGHCKSRSPPSWCSSLGTKGCLIGFRMPDCNKCLGWHQGWPRYLTWSWSGWEVGQIHQWASDCAWQPEDCGEWEWKFCFWPVERKFWQERGRKVLDKSLEVLSVLDILQWLTIVRKTSREEDSKCESLIVVIYCSSWCLMWIVHWLMAMKTVVQLGIDEEEVGRCSEVMRLVQGALFKNCSPV